jgi:predicted amidohydrolase
MIGSLLLALLATGCIEQFADYQYLSGPNAWSGATTYDDSDADLVLDIATTSMKVDADPAINRQAMLDRIEEIVSERPSTQIVVFGEVITGLYQVGEVAETVAYQESIAEAVPGPTSDVMAEAAAEHGLYVAFGIAQRDGDDLYNAFVLVNPAGEVQAIHHKTLTVHTNGESSLDEAFSNGDGATTTDIAGVPFGMIVCNDMHSLRIAEDLVEGEVRVVLEALADDVKAPPEGGWSAIPPIWNAWVIQANRYGTEESTSYPGAAAILDPAGSVRASMNGEGWIADQVGVFL